MARPIPSLKDIVKDNYVYFDSYRAGFFYYHVTVDCITYQFTVDREDVGDATLDRSDKAIYFMRWIRKAIDGNQFIVIQDNSLDGIVCEDCGEQLLCRFEVYAGKCDTCLHFKSDEKIDYSALGNDTEKYFPERKSLRLSKDSKAESNDDKPF